MARRDTRELILQTSLALFNDQGEPNVSTNDIALEADISPGNLYYHFRNRDDITLELFKRYLEELLPLLEPDPADSPPSAEALYLRLHLIFEAMGRYRFIYRNLADLHHRIDNLRHAMNGLSERLRAALERVMSRLRTAGILIIDENEASALATSTLVQLTFWIAFAEIQGDPGLVDGRTLSDTAARVLYLFAPYLRQPESDQFRSLAADYLSV